MNRLGLTVLLVLVAASVYAEHHDFNRYQPIIDRQMFGELPPDFDPEKMPSEVSKTSAKAGAELTKEQEQLRSAIRFTSINITPAGETAVGFMDNTDPKAPRHYYLKVGERRNGWELKEADAEKATMTIAKGDVEVSLSLGGDSSKSAEATTRRSANDRRGGPRNLMSRQDVRRPRRKEMLARMVEMEEERKQDREARQQEREAMRDALMSMKEELQAAREKSEASKPKESEGNENSGGEANGEGDAG